MTLGERIYALRTAKNLSQGDLAEALDVSRQSVSKWETDTSVPDLDKLVKLCDLFGVTMDELVRGEAPQAAEPAEPQMVVQKAQKESSAHSIIGMALLLIGIAIFTLSMADGGGFPLASVSAPFVISGIVCMAVPRHPILWGSWVLCVLLSIWLTWAVGVSMWKFFAFGWILFLVLAVLIIATVFAFRKKEEKP